MSEDMTTLAIVAGVLALAAVAVRRLIGREPKFWARFTGTLAGAVLGILGAGWLGSWSDWPAGLIVGLAAYEAGPVIFWGGKRLVRKLTASSKIVR